MSAPAAEVMRRGARLATLHAAGVPNPVEHIGSDLEMNIAIDRWLEPPAAVAVAPRGTLRCCTWCGRYGDYPACERCADLEEALAMYQSGADLID